jgi:hypothetical protein
LIDRGERRSLSPRKILRKSLTPAADTLYCTHEAAKKRYVTTEENTGDTEELRMQLREVAFALIQGKEVRPDMLR